VFHSRAEQHAHGLTRRHSDKLEAFERGEQSGARQAYLFLQRSLACMPHPATYDPPPPFTHAATSHHHPSPAVHTLLTSLATSADSDALYPLRCRTAAHEWHCFLHAVRTGMTRLLDDDVDTAQLYRDLCVDYDDVDAEQGEEWEEGEEEDGYDYES